MVAFFVTQPFGRASAGHEPGDIRRAYARTVIEETDIRLRDGRTLHVYDTGNDAALTVFWHHGTPQIGTPPDPFLADRRDVRWVGYDRPAYGASTRQPGRTIASAAGDVAAIADALGIDRFAVVGHSGGSAHALAAAALLPDRVVRAVCMAALAPADAEGLDWFAGMAAAGAAELRAAADGEHTLGALLASTEFDETQFTPTDHAALAGAWSFLGRSAQRATRDGPAGMIDDDVAYVRPWGFDVAQVRAPVLYVHGDADRVAPPAHSRWLAEHGSATELWIRPGDGHLSVLDCYTDALTWLTG
jgi:pimeloyl-ACP methyl ester carboxylesterase